MVLKDSHQSCRPYCNTRKDTRTKVITSENIWIQRRSGIYKSPQCKVPSLYYRRPKMIDPRQSKEISEDHREYLNYQLKHQKCYQPKKIYKKLLFSENQVIGLRAAISPYYGNHLLLVIFFCRFIPSQFILLFLISHIIT